MECEICGNTNFNTVYHGEVRDGKDQYIISTVRECFTCDVWRLDDSQPPENYVDGAYREKLQQGTDPKDFFARHDDEQIYKLLAIARKYGLGWLRGKCVLDVGAGPGAFLSFLSGIASHLAAVEPCRDYLYYLDKYVTSLAWSSLDEMRGAIKADIVTCFDTLEHVQNPLYLIEQMRQVGTELLLSVPDRNESRIISHRDYFSTQHKWYWDERSFSNMLRLAGIQVNEIYSEPEEIGPQIYAWC